MQYSVIWAEAAGSTAYGGQSTGAVDSANDPQPGRSLKKLWKQGANQRVIGVTKSEIEFVP